MGQPTINRREIYWVCVLALFTAALANALRAGVAGALKAALLDPIDAQHSGEMIGTVLGGLLLDNGAWDRAGDLLQEEDFYRHEHKLIFGAIGGLIGHSKPADVVTVFEQLQTMGKADEVGGMRYLNALAQSVPSAANMRRYAEIVRERAVLRKLVTVGDEIAANALICYKCGSATEEPKVSIWACSKES